MEAQEIFIRILLFLGIYLSGVFLTWLCIRYTEVWYELGKRDPVGYFVVWIWPVAGPIALVTYTIIWIIKTFEPWWSHIMAKFDWIMGFILKGKIHSDEYGTLYRMPSPLGPIRIVKVSDNTGTYWLKVPPETTKAKDGVAWTYNKKPDDFQPRRV